MAFALTVNQLVPALKQPGCPICNLQRATVQRFLTSFLQENLMDRAARQKVLDSLGFCPTHTFELAAMEMRTDGDPLGTNILHEQINGRVQQALRKWQSGRRSVWLGDLQSRLLSKLVRRNQPLSRLQNARCVRGCGKTVPGLWLHYWMSLAEILKKLRLCISREMACAWGIYGRAWMQ